jgi:hypothetical protein
MFDDLIAGRATNPALAALTPLHPGSVERIRGAFPGAPEDYLRFLQQVGSGEMGAARYTLYSGLVPAEEIYGDTPPGLEHVVLFGDDMQGYCAGFRTAAWTVVEVDPTDREARPAAGSFEQLVRRTIAGG